VGAVTNFLSSHYDIDTIADIDPSDWDRFRTDLQALISYFQLSSIFQVRLTVNGSVKSWPDSVQVPFWGVEIALCRTRGMTTIKNKFEGVEDLFVRALIVLYSHHGRGKTAVFASGSEGAWGAARTIAEQATNRTGVGSAPITVDESRIKKTAARDGRIFASICDAPLASLKVRLDICPRIEKRWFF
jgi:hypothetical protein